MIYVLKTLETLKKKIWDRYVFNWLNNKILKMSTEILMVYSNVWGNILLEKESLIYGRRKSRYVGACVGACLCMGVIG